MGFRIVRKILAAEGRLELVLDEKQVFWRINGERAVDKKQEILFKQYNPNLKRALNRLIKITTPEIHRQDLIDNVGLREKQLSHYLSLHKRKLRYGCGIMPLESAYGVLVDFIPILEGWISTGYFSRNYGVNRDTVRHHCNRRTKEGYIESVIFPMGYNWLSPIGEANLYLHFNLRKPNKESQDNEQTPEEVARALGLSRSRVTDYCFKHRIICRETMHGWRIPLEGRNQILAMMKPKEDFWQIGDEKYHSMISVAREAALIFDEDFEKYVKRFSGLVRDYPNDPQLDIMNKNDRPYVGEDTRAIFLDLFRSSDARRLLGISKFRFCRLMNSGEIKSYQIGPTQWPSYKSLMEYHAQNN